MHNSVMLALMLSLVFPYSQRGVYIPARKANLPKFVAVLATFLASSLFHEWILTST